MKNLRTFTAAAAAALLLNACGGGSNTADDTAFTTEEALGAALFFDTNLSFNRTQSCATCHNPEHAFIDDRENAVAGAVSLGDNGTSLGDRNAPTAAYAKFSPLFTLSGAHPRGGQFLDGREDDLKGQAGGPPTNPIEMGMPDKAAVVARIEENSDYVDAFKHLYGEAIFSDADVTYAAMAQSIAKFEKTETFAPFDSRYDRYLQGEYVMTSQEELGMALFFSEANTNCAACHQLNSQSEVAGETFSNYEFHNIGVPPNTDLYSADTPLAGGVIDDGLFRNPAASDEAHKGKFKTPTLRNVAVTGPYMHNGVFKELRTVIEFYDHMGSGERPNNPETALAWRDPETNATVNLTDLSMPVLSDAKIDALVAFLKTLTDKRYEQLLR
jgi:cytochrome c peroxidase